MAADSIIGAGLAASPYVALHDQLSELAAHNRRLREENERLERDLAAAREALSDMWSGLRYVQTHYGKLPGVGWDRLERKASAILAAAPAKEAT